MENTVYVFVYGTLRKGCSNDIRGKYDYVQYIGDAVARGVLYALEGFPYPGIVLPGTEWNGAEGVVKGEMYRVDETVLASLDEFEGYNPDNLADSFYWRKEVSVSLEGRVANCFIYELNLAKYQVERIIASGDWKNFIEENPVILAQKEDWPLYLKKSD